MSLLFANLSFKKNKAHNIKKKKEKHKHIRKEKNLKKKMNEVVSEL
jgi:hypothetical protein